MPGGGQQLAQWACAFEPTPEDLELARRSLLDTMAVLLAARDDPIRPVLTELSEPGQWAALAHVLDYDDLHLPSTTHISVVCVSAALAAGGDARAYLAGAGAMARLGMALGWAHYRAGWHATCTAGAPAAAVAAGVAMGLDAPRLATALALALPGAGGVQRAFGTTAKALQVAFAVETGLRAAGLARAGAGADPGALEDWLAVVGGDPDALEVSGPAVPGGLAMKVYPCCYALQRPIAALSGAGPGDPERIQSISVRTPAVTLTPLIHHRPRTGLEGKFSLEYGLAAALLDGQPGLDSFTDAAVQRPQAQRLVGVVQTEATDGGRDLLAGVTDVEVELTGNQLLEASLALPPGAPGRPARSEDVERKLSLCVPEEADELRALTWETAVEFLRANAKLPASGRRQG